MNFCVWDLGIHLNSMAPTGYTYTMNVSLLQLLGSTNTFGFILYANCTTQVWDPGRQLCMNSYNVGIRENKMVGVEIIGISLTTIKGNNADLENDGSQSSRGGLYSTTNTSTLVSVEDWKALFNCLALQRRTITIVMISNGYKEVVEQYYLQHLQVQFLRQRDTKLWFLLLSSSYYEFLEPYMHTLLELITAASNKDEDVVTFQAIELWSKVPKLDSLQCCKKNFSFRWINLLLLGLKTQMFSPKEEELIVSLHVIFEQRRAQIAAQLTKISQDQLASFFSLAPSVPIRHFGLLMVEYVMLGSRCTIGEIAGIVMCGKISYFFGARGALCFSESFCPVGWLAITFGRNILWFDIGSVLMCYDVWVILFMVPTYITDIPPKHLQDSFLVIVNQLMLCCGGSLIVQLFSLFFIRESHRWLTKATDRKACATSLIKNRLKTQVTISLSCYIPVHFLLKGHDKFRKKLERILVELICSFFVASWTGVVKYHSPRPSIQPKQVFVANHTSMIDFVILEQMTAFAVIMQKHPG